MNNKNSYIWNSIGGILNAMQSVIVLMVITRTAGLDAAGIYSIAFATGNLFMYLGNYGVRNYQVSDLTEQFSFADYRHHRYVTVLLMLLLSLAFCLYHLADGSYSAEKTAVVFAMCVLKCEDCIEEVFEGRLHQKGHLDLAGKMMTVRLLVSIGGMLAVLVAGGTLLASVVSAIALAVAAFAAMTYHYRGEIAAQADMQNDNDALAEKRSVHQSRAQAGVQFDESANPQSVHQSRAQAGTQSPAGKTTGAVHVTSHRHPIVALMKVCFPVCAANFLSFYLINAPKYAIDAVMDEASQARYNFIAMPVFVIQLLTMFIYQPVMVQMTKHWQEARGQSTSTTPHTDTKKSALRLFRKDFFSVVGWLLIISAVVLLGAYILGIPVLSLLYATDLSDLKSEFMLLLFGSIFLAMNGFYCAVLTLMRLQNRIPVYYLVGTILSLWVTSRMVRAYGIAGGVFSFTVIMILVCLLLTIQFITAMRHVRQLLFRE